MSSLSLSLSLSRIFGDLLFSFSDLNDLIFSDEVLGFDIADFFHHSFKFILEGISSGSPFYKY